MNRISTDIYPVRLTVSYVMDHFVGICIPNNLHSYIYEYIGICLPTSKLLYFYGYIVRICIPNNVQSYITNIIGIFMDNLLEYAFPTIDTVKVMNLVGI